MDSIDIKLAVDFGDMPAADAARVAEKIKEAVAMYGRPHIKILYRSMSHRFDPETKSQTVEITSETLGTTLIGEAIVAALGSTWNV